MAGRPQKILDAAAHLFAQRGYGATSIDDIGAAAGVSGPAIYWHFSGKAGLLAAMLTEVSERLLEGGRACVADASDAAAALDALVGMQVAFALDEADLIVVHARELRHLDADQAHAVRALQRQYVDVWVAVLRRLHPGVPKARLAAAVQAAIGLVNSTPFVRGVGRAQLGALLHRMAMGALATVAVPPTA